MKKKELYEMYKEEDGVRKVNRNVFYAYLKKYDWYKNVIAFLKNSKKTKNTKKGYTKWWNPKEIVDYAKTFSPEKAAKEYNISERTVYRYIENNLIK